MAVGFIEERTNILQEFPKERIDLAIVTDS